jgi:hypothetical protein
MDSITIESITTQLKPLERYAKEHKGMIGTAIGLTLVYRVFRMLNSGPPKRFKGLPYVTTWDIIKSIVEGNSTQEHYEKYVNPVLDKAHGLYVVSIYSKDQMNFFDLHLTLYSNLYSLVGNFDLLILV